MDRSKVTQVSIYADQAFLRKIKQEAQERRRKLGPTVAEILHEYFNKKEKTHARIETQDH